jgi:hypothetical protein
VKENIPAPWKNDGEAETSVLGSVKNNSCCCQASLVAWKLPRIDGLSFENSSLNGDLAIKAELIGIHGLYTPHVPALGI